MTRPRLVIVTWRDANGDAGDYEESRHHVPCLMFTVGWMVKRDARGITVACERYEDNGKWTYRGPTFVPAGVVVRVTTV